MYRSPTPTTANQCIASAKHQIQPYSSKSIGQILQASLYKWQILHIRQVWLSHCRGSKQKQSILTMLTTPNASYNSPHDCKSHKANSIANPLLAQMPQLSSQRCHQE